ncbi:hypothetical protein OG866_28405 [Streptomyces sp. NBC_00663]|uniref:hypothetical protein n=1 Tax=Streptomyces sp. NBC_00663 TaxID=2975801 RepID=UPI002E318DD3|nr:hypothetical protein [Streptomyces sp. NBC_00663]
MSAVLEKVNSSVEFSAIPSGISEAAWDSAQVPVLATPATVTPTLGNVTLGVAAFTGGIAVGDALFG